MINRGPTGRRPGRESRSVLCIQGIGGSTATARLPDCRVPVATQITLARGQTGSLLARAGSFQRPQYQQQAPCTRSPSMWTMKAGQDGAGGLTLLWDIVVPFVLVPMT